MKNTEKLYIRLAKLIRQNNNCLQTGKTEWFNRTNDSIKKIMDSAPSGSGIDSGTKLIERTNKSSIRFQADYHHMNEHGYYDGWTEHTITVKPSLDFGFELIISGRNRNEIKDYLAETFEIWLNSDVNTETDEIIYPPYTDAQYKAHVIELTKNAHSIMATAANIAEKLDSDFWEIVKNGERHLQDAIEYLTDFES